MAVRPNRYGRSCKSCRCFAPYVGEGREEDGECRRYAPRPTKDRDLSAPDRYAWWPIVSLDEWCAEWEERE